MTLQPDTLWIDAMMADEHILDRLIAHDPGIGKFRRVLNDERVAAALQIGDVARMLDLTQDAILAIARGDRPAGETKGETKPEPNLGSEAEEFAAGTSKRILDLRPIFERGQEPLAMILDEVAKLPDGTDFIIEAPFHPLPLRRLLGGRGFQSHTRQLSSEHWQVTFRRAAAA